MTGDFIQAETLTGGECVPYPRLLDCSGIMRVHQEAAYLRAEQRVHMHEASSNFGRAFPPVATCDSYARRAAV